MKMPPKPLIAVGIVAVAAGAYTLLRPESEDARWLGYVEGEPLLIAAPVSGTLAARPVMRGQAVDKGEALFTLDPQTADADAAQLAAQVAAAKAQAADLAQGRNRAPEQAAASAALTSAKAQAVRADADYQRIAALAGKGFASRTQLDAARAARDSASAALQQAQAVLASGGLSAGRPEQQAAAQASVGAAEAALRAQARRRQEIAPVAAARGVVQQTFFDPGEWVPANQPVLALLPDDQRKLRFFVPQDRVAALKVGAKVRFTCDGCGDAARAATISYISPRAEFTPPVIYSERARAKLVFMVEAALPVAQPLPLGLPVAVAVQ
ncbi:HlyD family efflux transporter periplasmic adaptor subunit [Novosphingobium sp. ERN07]|uniref:HlyD family secretion protein n=1 Tax=Novosphingobium sp. ERN07 TaxID=2726187 RepID=UPI0014572DB2|nr:HlyD family secretion protein [Novosphingobium sp. ERN07]NLR71018.1 HlyD family efflux transporter periplasmic adaptor subunit [Novosphingobium sp. ERN07]